MSRSGEACCCHGTTWKAEARCHGTAARSPPAPSSKIACPRRQGAHDAHVDAHVDARGRPCERLGGAGKPASQPVHARREMGCKAWLGSGDAPRAVRRGTLRGARTAAPPARLRRAMLSPPPCAHWVVWVCGGCGGVAQQRPGGRCSGGARLRRAAAAAAAPPRAPPPPRERSWCSCAERG
jgi:hypothetical protein